MQIKNWLDPMMGIRAQTELLLVETNQMLNEVEGSVKEVSSELESG
jgi:uncharacterized protein YoxC